MMNFLIFGAIVSLAFKTNALYNLKSEHGNQYYIETENAYNWYEAVHGCVLQNASLVAIESNDEQKEIFKMLNDYFTSETLSKLRLWSAGHDNGKKGTHKWITNGRELMFTNWASKEPNNADDKEHCIELRPGDFQWNDVPCSVKMGYICEENLLVQDNNFKCNQQIDDLKKSHEQAMDKKQLKLDDLNKSHEEELNILLQSHKQQLDDRGKELDELKKSHQEALNTALQKNIDELEAVKKFHVQIMDEYKLELDTLKKSNENATNILLEEKNTELNVLRNSSASELSLALEAQEKSCAKNTSILIENIIQKLINEKKQEREDFKDNHEKLKILEFTSIKKSHEDEQNLLRQEKEQELEALRKVCDENSKKFDEDKNQEVAPLQKTNQLEMDPINPTNSFKFYNGVFHIINGNSNIGNKH